MSALFGRTTHDELAAFLRRHGERWNVDGSHAFMESVDHLPPLETDELVAAMQWYGGDCDHVYLASDVYPASEVSRFFGREEAREVTAADLDQFVIKAVRGADFLYVFCSPEDVSNGSYVTILRAEEA